jgi:hypothetical protein
MLHQIIHAGKSPSVDLFVKVLQDMLITKKPMVRHARLGGEDGMRLHRAAFAIMVKFSQKLIDVVGAIDEIEFANDEYAKDMSEKERITNLKKSCKEDVQGFNELFVLWEKASVMRNWIINKKQNLSNKIEQDQTNEYLAKKKAELKK